MNDCFFTVIFFLPSLKGPEGLYYLWYVCFIITELQSGKGLKGLSRKIYLVYKTFKTINGFSCSYFGPRFGNKNDTKELWTISALEEPSLSWQCNLTWDKKHGSVLFCYSLCLVFKWWFSLWQILSKCVLWRKFLIHLSINFFIYESGMKTIAAAS